MGERFGADILLISFSTLTKFYAFAAGDARRLVAAFLCPSGRNCNNCEAVRPAVSSCSQPSNFKPLCSVFLTARQDKARLK